MSVILLADDSPHAQRMGSRILREEGYEVVCAAEGEEAALRLPEVDPDVVIADAYLPGLSGLDLCRYVKSSCRHVFLSRSSAILVRTVSSVFDSSETEIISTTLGGKRPLAANGFASDSPAEIFVAA